MSILLAVFAAAVTPMLARRGAGGRVLYLTGAIVAVLSGILWIQLTPSDRLFMANMNADLESRLTRVAFFYHYGGDFALVSFSAALGCCLAAFGYRPQRSATSPPAAADVLTMKVPDAKVASAPRSQPSPDDWTPEHRRSA